MNGWYPDKLFRYRRINTSYFDDELKHLRENKVWLNFLHTQNDPFEGCVSNSVISYDYFLLRNKELREALKKNFPDLDPDLLPETIPRCHFDEYNLHSPCFHEKVRKRAVVASFSKVWQNTLMWGHYADGFKGICLEFTASPTVEVDGRPPFFPVQYWTEKPPEFSPFDFFVQMHLSAGVERLEESKNRNALENLAHEKIKLAATSKSFDWAYEQEFRMLSFIGEPGYYQVPGMKLTSIIFGPLEEGKDHSKIIDIFGQEISYSKMKLDENAYRYQLADYY